MKSIFIATLLALSLSACIPTNVKPDVVVQYEYVARKAPPELFVIPPYTPAIDLSTATQSNIAEWLLKNEARTQELENKIIQIRKFQDTPIVPTK